MEKDFPTGEQYRNSEHFFSHDIDLFGRGSFYQYLNRTALESGSDMLARLLTQNEITDISKKQEAIKEIGAMPSWRQRFAGIASLVKVEMPSQAVQQWLSNYKAFTPKGIDKVSVGFSIVSIILWVLYFTDLISGYYVFGWFLLGLVTTGAYFKKVNALVTETSKVQSTFEQYYKLLAEIEQQDFKSKLLREKRALLTSEHQQASEVLKQFSKHLDTLDKRSNMLMGVILNGFGLHDLRATRRIEKWIESHTVAIEVWFATIATFDAYNSLGNYAFNHPSHTYPEITNDTTVINGVQAAHPLLNPDVAVRNDITIKSEQFFITTGANMAGKSTFLRTVALQIVMGNTGLPVSAEKASYTPVKLITSMRTTDSLTDDESYFFSELKRLKFIVDQIKKDRYFIILDEILKGTNSTDKAIGSRKFIDKLVGSNATGIIATHDLSLCQAADDLEEVENYYFDAQIIDGELYFDYTFKKGICQNMNASFLLKKMEIID